MREGRMPTLGRRGRRAARVLLVPLIVVASGCIVDAAWTPQAVEPVVDPVPDRFTLADVACPEDDACVAVGSLGTLPLTSEPIVLRQVGGGAGAEWQRVDLPPVLPAARGVSCTGVDDCVVLGTIDLRYHDGELSVLPPPPLDGASGSAALDCTAGPNPGCLQVDGASSAWWDGTSWSAPAPLPAGIMPETPQLSCTAPTSCLLVATEPGVEGWPTPGTVTSTTWDGTAWSPVVTLDHPTRPLDLDCATATACFATAGLRADYWTQLFPPVPAEVLRWDGTGWTAEAIPHPGGAVPTEPGTVSCSSASTCTVLSVAGAGTPPSPTVVAQWDGAGWTAAATDAASPATALACTAPTSCTSTGTGVAQHYDGATWSDATLPGGTSPAEVLTAVSCATEDDCVAVGSGWTLRAPAEGPLLTPTLQRFDGESWTAEDAGDDDLRHVSCPTASSCMAAGSDLGSFWSRHWDGTTWRELPRVTDLRAGGVTGLSCPTTAWCLLTTTQYTGGGDLAWVWTGGDAWAELAALPNLSGTTTGLSCPVPGDCVAVANWIGPQAFRLSGGTWSPIDLAGLGLDNLANVEDVDCAAPGECAVVGLSGYVDSRPQGLLAVLSDGTWSLAERDGVGTIDVDCWSADGCVAVASGDLPHLELWDGARWRVVANPPGLAQPTAVSCGAPGRCEVTGSFTDGAERAPIAAVALDP
jgi:hypothetical protein